MPFDATPNTVADVLRRAKALIDTPEKWTQCYFSDGKRHCIAGALIKVGASAKTPVGILARSLLIEAAGCHESIMGWNDTAGRTHADVMAAFDKAIALAEQEG